MVDLFEAMAKRHSYRGHYTDAPVSREDLTRIVEAGLLAPTGKNEQTTQFVIVDDPALLEPIRALHGMPCMLDAPAMIVCLIDRDPPMSYHNTDFQVEDCAAAVEHMLLAITALGYASVWIDGALRVEERAEKLARILSLPAGKIPRVLLPVGVPTESKRQPPKLPFAQRAWFNHYGGAASTP